MYFDNAATTHPKPEVVYATMDAFFRGTAGNAGRGAHRVSVAASMVLSRARLSLARLLGINNPDRLVWTSNATEAINLALKGLLRPGDRVVTTAFEHNSTARPLRSLEKAGVELVRVPCPGGRFDLETFLEAITPGTALVTMLHASNVTGAVLPVAEVGASCRQRGVPFMVDAAQTVGTLPVDVREIGADLLAVPGHKGLHGPPGTGALYVREGIELPPLVEGGTGSASERDTQPETLPGRYESGTQNSLGIAGLGAGVDWILETGRETVHRKEAALTEQLWRGLAETPGVALHGPPPGAERAPIVSCTLEGWEPTDAAAVLDQQFDIQCRAGLHCAPWAHQSLGSFPAGTIRLSPGYFNTEAEVEAVIAAFRAIAGVGMSG
jgi:cysteine desulfurase/selenocysteine lyase